MQTGMMARPVEGQRFDFQSLIAESRNKLAEKGKMVRDLTQELHANSDMLDRVYKSLPRVVGRNASTGLTFGVAYAAGYADEYLVEKKSNKIGPLNAVATIGTLVAIGSATFIENPDLAEAGLAFGRGAAAPEFAKFGRATRMKHREAAAQAKAKAA